MRTSTHGLGLTTLAACGPLDESVLDDSPLRVCDVGHVAIAWSDWDTLRCPICARMGTLSGIVSNAFERERDVIDEAALDKVLTAERAESDLRDAIIGAKMTLRRALDDDATMSRELVETAYWELDDAL